MFSQNIVLLLVATTIAIASLSGVIAQSNPTPQCQVSQFQITTATVHTVAVAYPTQSYNIGLDAAPTATNNVVVTIDTSVSSQYGIYPEFVVAVCVNSPTNDFGTHLLPDPAGDCTVTPVMNYTGGSGGETVAVSGFNTAPNAINYIYVGVNSTAIPSGQNNSAFAKCNQADIFVLTNPASVSGDPQFVGLRGQSFQVHGIDGAVYNLITDTTFQLNSQFVFLNGPRGCPEMPSSGMLSVACWSHPGSYLSNLGLLTHDNERVLIESGSYKIGMSVLLNNQSIKVGSTVQLSVGSLKFVSTHEIKLIADVFSIEVENSDEFLNLKSVSIAPQHWKTLKSHGLLGQTWQRKLYKSSLAVIEGEVDDYAILSNDVFGSDFAFDKFSLFS